MDETLLPAFDDLLSNKFVATTAISRINGPLFRAHNFGVSIGDIVSIAEATGSATSQAKVVGLEREEMTLAPLAGSGELSLTHQVSTSHRASSTICHPAFFGSAIGYNGRERGRFAPVAPDILQRLKSKSLLSRSPTCKRQTHHSLTRTLETGLRGIDAFTSIAFGQRLSVFAPPGVGKSSLLTQLSKTSKVDVTIISLIGERSREITEVIESLSKRDDSGNILIVCAASNEPPMAKITAGEMAVSIAEWCADSGMDVLLLFDSLTRFVRAQREIGLSLGEIPVRRGYPSSVFASLPDLTERCGEFVRGSITAFFTVLLSSDLEEDPLVDEIRGLTDGHLTLSKDLATRGIYPALDIVSSLSRVSHKLQTEDSRAASSRIRYLLSRLQQEKELIAVGAVLDDELKQAIQIESKLESFLGQNEGERSSLDDTEKSLLALTKQLGAQSVR